MELHNSNLQAVITLQKGRPGARKVRGPLFSVPKQSNLKKSHCYRGNNFLVYQNKVISKKQKKDLNFREATVKCSEIV